MNAAVATILAARDQAMRQIRELLDARGVERVEELTEKDQLYCAALFLGSDKDWLDDLVPAEVPELYAVIPAMLMADFAAKDPDSFDRHRNLWSLMRRACLKQAAHGITHKLDNPGIPIC